jgi:hypothetical protein
MSIDDDDDDDDDDVLRFYRNQILHVLFILCVGRLTLALVYESL